MKRRRTYTGLNGVISQKEVLMLLMVYKIFCIWENFFHGCCNFKLVTMFLLCVCVCVCECVCVCVCVWIKVSQCSLFDRKIHNCMETVSILDSRKF